MGFLPVCSSFLELQPPASIPHAVLLQAFSELCSHGSDSGSGVWL